MVSRLAIVDWLRFSFLPLLAEREQVQDLLSALRSSSSLPLTLAQSDKGIHGYKSSYDVSAYVDGEALKLGTIGLGGDHIGGTMMLDLTGKGCSLINDWHLIHSLLTEYKARITRVDCAVDFLEGEVSIDQIRSLYFAGEFNAGGRTPSYFEYSGGSLDCEGFNGRTFEIGKRKNGKLVRAYEKGRQLGNQFSLWVRIEVELGSRDRIIPYEVVVDPTKYFIGAHKALEQFLSGSSERIKTIQKHSDMNLDKSEQWIKQSAGKHIDQLLKHRYKSPAEFVDAVRVNGIPNKLIIPALAKHMTEAHDPASISKGNKNGTSS